MPSLERVRARLDEYIIKSGRTYRELSLKIGRKDCYIQQYVKYGFPKRLNELDRKKLCILLKIDEEELIDDELLQNSTAEGLLLRLDEIKEVSTDFMCMDIYSEEETGLNDKKSIGKMTLNRQIFNNWQTNGSYNTKMAMIRNNDMEPVLEAGDLVCFDGNVHGYIKSGVYLIRRNKKACFRWVEEKEEKYIIRTENGKIKTEEFNKKEVEFIGKVISVLKRKDIK